jgi:hypothetical protein
MGTDPMNKGRSTLCAALMVALLFVCPDASAGIEIFEDGFEPLPDCIATPSDPRCPTFTSQSSAIEVPAGTLLSTCYYFRTPNQASIGVRKFQSTLGQAVTDIIVYADYSNGTPVERQPPGTVSSVNCGISHNGSIARRVYQAHETDESLTMPSDDGAGMPVALELLPNQPLFIQIHLLNATDQPLMASVSLDVFALEPGVAYTRTATYTTYNGNLSIPPSSVDAESQTCSEPMAKKFWWFSTHTHKQGTNATLRNGLAPIVSSDDWENPNVAVFGPPSFYQFSGAENLTYECTYNNVTTRTITSGESRDLDEQCVGITYYFPATGPLICLNSVGPF